MVHSIASILVKQALQSFVIQLILVTVFSSCLDKNPLVVSAQLHTGQYLYDVKCTRIFHHKLANLKDLSYTFNVENNSF